MSVTIRPVGKSQRLVADMAGDDTVTGGVGGWEQLARPRRTAAVAWVGTPAMQWQIPLVLDGFDANRSVERDCSRLEGWGKPVKGDPPPVLLVETDEGRGPANSKWVLDSIDWGDQARNGSGERIQQYLTITLLEYVPGQILKGPAAKSRDKRNKGKGDKGKDGKGNKGKGGAFSVNEDDS